MSSNSRNKVLREILRMIDSGEAASGKIISEAQLCKELGLSRTPVREALIEATANGILKKVPNKGYQMYEQDENTQWEKFLIISVLDALAAKLAIANMTDKDYAKMEEYIDMMDVAIRHHNYAVYRDFQQDFHDIYIQKCGNKTLIDEIDHMKYSIARYTYYLDNQEDLFALFNEANNEHREMLRLFRQEDAQGLERLLIDVHWAQKLSPIYYGKKMDETGA